MPRFFNPFFKVDVPIPKRRFTFCFCGVKQIKEARSVFSDSDTATAPACDGFDPDRIPDFLSELRGIFSGVYCPFFAIFTPTALAAGYEFQPRLCHSFACFHLVTHRGKIFNGGSNKLYLMRLTYFRELRVLRQKACSRMDGVDIRIIRNSNNIGVFEITLS